MTVLEWGLVSDVGLTRQLNEDAIIAQPPLFAVADGMGGHAAGEIAAGLALDQLRSVLSLPSVKSTDIVDSIARANTRIVEWAAQQVETVGMGTTLAGICLGTVAGSAHWIVFNVGDSRVYRYRDGLLEQLTVDHSEVQELVARGRLSPAQARVHPQRNIVTRSLGTQPAPEPDVWVVPAQEDETYVICSDGLTGELEDDVIRQALTSHSSAQECAQALCDLALAAGGHDNISVVIVHDRDTPSSGDVDGATAPRPNLREG